MIVGLQKMTQVLEIPVGNTQSPPSACEIRVELRPIDDRDQAPRAMSACTSVAAAELRALVVRRRTAPGLVGVPAGM